MRLGDYIRIAISNLLKRKIRTSLTTFAVVIGAMLISIMVSLGAGVEGFISAQINSIMPPDVISVSPKAEFGPKMIIKFTGLFEPAEIPEEGFPFRMKHFTADDIAKMEAIPHVERVDPIPLINARWVKLEGAEKRHQVTVLVPAPYVFELRKLVAGRHLREDDRGKAVVAYRYMKVWGYRDSSEVLGKRIIIGVPKGMYFGPFSVEKMEEREFKFEIVGVLEDTILATEVQVPFEDGVRMARYNQNDNTLYRPRNMGISIAVKVDEERYIEGVAREIEEMGDFKAETPEETMGSLRRFFAVVEGILSVFGLIALGVASLGIINTLVMSIYERTREIGVMKAVGATRGAIRMLFIVEGGAIGFFGGIVGVFVAFCFGRVINFISHATWLKEYPTFKISAFPPWLVLGVIGLCTGVAVLAALYPAIRASRLDPVEALRYE